MSFSSLHLSLLWRLALGCILIASPVVHAQSATVTFKDGTRLVGSVVSRSDTQVTLATQHLGNVTFKTADVDSFSVAEAAPTPPGVTPQAPTSSTATAQAAAAVTPQSAAKWSFNSTLGLSWTGATVNNDFVDSPSNPGLPGDIIGYSLQSQVTRVSELWTVSLAGDYAFSEIEPNDTPTTEKWSLRLFSSRKLNEDWELLGQTYYAQDEVSGDRHWNSLLGAGTMLVKNDKMTFYVAPGVAYTDYEVGSNNGLAIALGEESAASVGLGFFNRFTYAFNPFVSFEQTATYVKSLEKESQNYLDFNAKFVGMVSKHVGLQVSYDFSYNSERPEPLMTVSQGLTTGVTVKY